MKTKGNLRDPRIDAYIEKAQPFAQPILKHLRKIVHQANPNIEETIKWGFPAFEYKGPMCSMASFKQHLAFGFWKSDLIRDPKGILQESKINGGSAMGHLGKITQLTDLPSDKILIKLIQDAIRLNDDGIKLPSKPKISKKDITPPDYLLTALSKNKKAQKIFNEFSPYNKKEYIDWLEGAKTEKTRISRLETAIEWIGEGKIRNWKYV